MSVLIATAKSSIENIGYLFDGYDILFGSPLNAGSESGIAGPDPGFRQTIWQADYSDCLRSEDNNIAIPRGLTVTSCGGSCKISFTSTIINGTKKFIDVMDNKVCVSAILGGSSTCGRTDNQANDDDYDEDGDGDREKRSVRNLIRRKRFIPALFRNIFGKLTGRSGKKGRRGKNRKSRGNSQRSRSRGSRRSGGSGSRSRGRGSKRSKEKKKGASRSESDIFGSKDGGSSRGDSWWKTVGGIGILDMVGGDGGDESSGSSGSRFQVNIHSFFPMKQTTVIIISQSFS